MSDYLPTVVVHITDIVSEIHENFLVTLKSSGKNIWISKKAIVNSWPRALIVKKKYYEKRIKRHDVKTA